jgi:hypothetical protein
MIVQRHDMAMLGHFNILRNEPVLYEPFDMIKRDSNLNISYTLEFVE